jgi:hypothetical protein
MFNDSRCCSAEAMVGIIHRQELGIDYRRSFAEAPGETHPLPQRAPTSMVNEIDREETLRRKRQRAEEKRREKEARCLRGFPHDLGTISKLLY